MGRTQQNRGKKGHLRGVKPNNRLHVQLLFDQRHGVVHGYEDGSEGKKDPNKLDKTRNLRVLLLSG